MDKKIIVAVMLMATMAGACDTDWIVDGANINDGLFDMYVMDFGSGHAGAPCTTVSNSTYQALRCIATGAADGEPQAITKLDTLNMASDYFDVFIKSNPLSTGGYVMVKVYNDTVTPLGVNNIDILDVRYNFQAGEYQLRYKTVLKSQVTAAHQNYTRIVKRPGSMTFTVYGNNSITALLTGALPALGTYTMSSSEYAEWLQGAYRIGVSTAANTGSSTIDYQVISGMSNITYYAAFNVKDSESLAGIPDCTVTNTEAITYDAPGYSPEVLDTSSFGLTNITQYNPRCHTSADPQYLYVGKADVECEQVIDGSVYASSQEKYFGLVNASSIVDVYFASGVQGLKKAQCFEVSVYNVSGVKESTLTGAQVALDSLQYGSQIQTSDQYGRVYFDVYDDVLYTVDAWKGTTWHRDSPFYEQVPGAALIQPGCNELRFNEVADNASSSACNVNFIVNMNGNTRACDSIGLQVSGCSRYAESSCGHDASYLYTSSMFTGSGTCTYSKTVAVDDLRPYGLAEVDRVDVLGTSAASALVDFTGCRSTGSMTVALNMGQNVSQTICFEFHDWTNNAALKGVTYNLYDGQRNVKTGSLNATTSQICIGDLDPAVSYLMRATKANYEQYPFKEGEIRDWDASALNIVNLVQTGLTVTNASKLWINGTVTNGSAGLGNRKVEYGGISNYTRSDGSFILYGIVPGTSGTFTAYGGTGFSDYNDGLENVRENTTVLAICTPVSGSVKGRRSMTIYMTDGSRTLSGGQVTLACSGYPTVTMSDVGDGSYTYSEGIEGCGYYAYGTRSGYEGKGVTLESSRNIGTLKLSKSTESTYGICAVTGRVQIVNGSLTSPAKNTPVILRDGSDNFVGQVNTDNNGNYDFGSLTSCDTTYKVSSTAGGKTETVNLKTRGEGDSYIPISITLTEASTMGALTWLFNLLMSFVVLVGVTLVMFLFLVFFKVMEGFKPS